MPFKSEAQRGFLYAKHPKIAERFQEETPKNAKLPEHVKKMNQGGFAGDWQDELADHMDRQYGGQPVETQSMADGGFAGMGYDVDAGASSPARGAPYVPPPAPALPPIQPPAPVFNPKAGLPPAPIAPPAPAAPPPAPAGPDPLQAYLSQQRGMLDRYGPEEQMALERDILKRRQGFVPNLANAGAGLADAIMQGVARAGSSNFQSNLQNRLDKTQEGERQALEHAQTGHLAKMKQEMELAQLDPESPLSRLAQRSASPLLKSLGLSDDEIQNIPASLIGEAQTKHLSLEEIRAKAEETRALREQTSEYQRMMIENTASQKAAELAERAQGRRLGAAKDVLGMDKSPRILGVPIWTSPVSGKARKAAMQTIEEGLQPSTSTAASPQGTFEPDVLKYAETHGITPEQAQIQKQRRLGRQPQ